jgi:hypothetical protein
MKRADRYCNLEDTDYGFVWGPVAVERWASDEEGSVILGLTTKKETLEIRVTPTGLIRVGTPVKTST